MTNEAKDNAGRIMIMKANYGRCKTVGGCVWPKKKRKPVLNEDASQ